MVYTLKVSETGDLYLPSEILGKIQQGTRYTLEIQGDILILRPVNSSNLSPAEKAAQWRSWTQSHSINSPGLPDEALHRENIYSL